MKRTWNVAQILFVMVALAIGTVVILRWLWKWGTSR